MPSDSFIIRVSNLGEKNIINAKVKFNIENTNLLETLKIPGIFEINQTTPNAVWLSISIDGIKHNRQFRIELKTDGERFVSFPVNTPVDIEMPTSIINTLSVLMAHHTSMISKLKLFNLQDKYFEVMNKNDSEELNKLFQDTDFKQYIKMPEIKIDFNWEEDGEVKNQRFELRSVYYPAFPFHIRTTSESELKFDPPTHKSVNGVNVELTQEESSKIVAEWIENASKPKIIPGVGVLYFENLKEPENSQYTQWKIWMESYGDR